MPCARHSVAASWYVTFDHEPPIVLSPRVPTPSAQIEMHPPPPPSSGQQRVAARPVTSSSHHSSTSPGDVHASAVSANGWKGA